MGATLLNGSVVGEESIIAAGALVPEGKVIPPRSLVMGSPGKVIREVTPERIESTLHFAEKYARLAGEYLEQVFALHGHDEQRMTKSERSEEPI
jgi:carbonic anhydrase/acetyltransferase-like protein (isoleucine patch superfamily)